MIEYGMIEVVLRIWIKLKLQEDGNSNRRTKTTNITTMHLDNILIENDKRKTRYIWNSLIYVILEKKRCKCSISNCLFNKKVYVRYYSRFVEIDSTPKKISSLATIYKCKDLQVHMRSPISFSINVNVVQYKVHIN